MKKWTPFNILCLSLTLFSPTIVFLTKINELVFIRQHSVINSILILLSKKYSKTIIEKIGQALPIIYHYICSLSNEGIKITTDILHRLSPLGNLLLSILDETLNVLIKIVYHLKPLFSILYNIIKIIANIIHFLFNIVNVLFLILNSFLDIIIKTVHHLSSISNILVLIPNLIAIFAVNIGHLMIAVVHSIVFSMTMFINIIVNSVHQLKTLINIFHSILNFIEKSILNTVRLLSALGSSIYSLVHMLVETDIKTGLPSNSKTMNETNTKTGLLSNSKTMNETNKTKSNSKKIVNKHIMEFLIFINIVSFLISQLVFFGDWGFVKKLLTICFCITFISVFIGFKVKETIFFASLLLIIGDICCNPCYYYSYYSMWEMFNYYLLQIVSYSGGLYYLFNMDNSKSKHIKSD